MRIHVTLLLVLMQITAMQAAADSSSLYFTSDPGSYIGQGQTLTATPADGYYFDPYVWDPSALQIRIETAAPHGDPLHDHWFLRLEAADGETLTVGSYPNAERFPGVGIPALDFTGNHRGTNTLTGHFEISEIQFDMGGQLLRLVVDFTQFEDGFLDKGIYGSLVYDAGVQMPAQSAAGVAALLIALATAGAYISLAKRSRISCHLTDRSQAPSRNREIHRS